MRYLFPRGIWMPTAKATKGCIKCGRELSPNRFGPRSGSRSHHKRAYCLECEAARSRHYREQDPERYKDRKLRREYGITLEEYRDRLRSQGYRCAICGTDDAGWRDFDVDHDHETGMVRGILCSGCNTLLGRARDSVRILLAAAHYLAENGNAEGGRADE